MSTAPDSVGARPGQSWSCPDWRLRTAATALLLLLLAALFRGLLVSCFSRWSTEPQYSHGFVIPLMAIGLGWLRRERVLPGIARCSSWGLPLLMAGIACHLTAVYLYVEALDGVGLLLSLQGCLLLVWGRRLFRGLWPAVAFLAFMLPLPFQLERLLSEPLQLLGAAESAWFLQTLGIPAVAQGATILMGETRLGVAEACSGLRMLMVFLAISVAAALISRRMHWERLLILLSAIPIALICNVLRIVATGVAHQYMGQQTADLIFHDLSGWLMMPMAMLLLWAELRLLDWLLIEADDRAPALCVSRGLSPTLSPPAR